MIIKEKNYNYNNAISESNFITKNNILNFSPEVITMIFSYLDFQSLQSSAMTCVKFYENSRNCFNDKKKQIINEESKDLEELLDFVINFIESDQIVSPENRKTIIDQLKKINIQLFLNEAYESTDLSNVCENGKSKMKNLQEIGTLDFYSFYFPEVMVNKFLTEIFEIINLKFYNTNILLNATNYFTTPERYAAFFDAETNYLNYPESFINKFVDWIKNTEDEDLLNFYIEIALLMSRKYMNENDQINTPIVKSLLSKKNIYKAGNYLLTLQFPNEYNYSITIANFIETVLNFDSNTIKNFDDEEIDIIKKVIDLIENKLKLNSVILDKKEIHKAFQKKLNY